MGRALRTNIANGWYHVMGRGLDRRGLFVDDRDRKHFEALTLRELGEQAGGMDYAAVSVMLKRFASRVENQPPLRTTMKQAIEMLNVETRHQ